MFDRLLGPKIDHSDPKVRAKAFALDSVEQATLIDALKTERDADVLCVILNRADSVDAILKHAQEGDGSIANQARTRLVALAESGSGSSADEWQKVYTAARAGNWAQLYALNDLLGPVAGREHVVQGALQTLPESHGLSERVLFTLATQSGSTLVRRLSALKLNSREMLEQCCNELKEKDKSVYRELKERVDAFRLEDEQRAHASQLLTDCESLAAMSIPAQAETVAVAQAKKQTLEQRVRELNEQAPAIAAAVVKQLARVSLTFDQALASSRSHVEHRRNLKTQLETLKSQFAATSDHQPSISVTELASIETAWGQIPDHSDLEMADFSRQFRTVDELVKRHEGDREVASQLQTRIGQWEKQVEKDQPTKLLGRIKRDWGSAEKPHDADEVAALQQRIDALQKRLEQREEQLARKRASNSEQLLKILDDFEAGVKEGEFKKAMALNDKLKARVASRELEPDTRQRIDAALKLAQPKLEEFRKWRHFGTQQARENLIGQANTLISEPPASPKALSVAVKALRESWRKLDLDDGRASEASWQTFSKACKEAYKPAKKHFDQLTKDRKNNLKTKKQLLESLEALLNDTDWESPDWSAVTKAHKDLVIQWQRSGSVDYKVKKEMEASFDSLNTRIDAQLNEKRESEIARRRRLIDELKALKETETGSRIASAAKRAQRDWRPEVQSDRKTEQALWEEFRGICDDIFTSLKQQQIDAKVAWQAEASERQEMIKQIDGILNPNADDSTDSEALSANQASGKLNEFAKQWRERHQIPASEMSKLETQYRQARRKAEERIAVVTGKERERAAARLDTLLALCQSAEEKLLSGDFEFAQFEANSAEFEALRGTAGKALQKWYREILKGMGGDNSVTQQLRQSHDSNLKARKELCLLGELIADIPSPEHAEQERMTLKMKRLTEAMQGKLESTDQELTNLIDQWYSAGGVAGTDWAQLSERFARVRAAQGVAGGTGK